MPTQYLMVSYNFTICDVHFLLVMPAGWIKHLPATFGVHKGDKDPIVVTLPREVQGKSELLVFMEPRPVKSKNNVIYVYSIKL